jgi:TPR repeat protein
MKKTLELIKEKFKNKLANTFSENQTEIELHIKCNTSIPHCWKNEFVDIIKELKESGLISQDFSGLPILGSYNITLTIPLKYIKKNESAPRTPSVEEEIKKNLLIPQSTIRQDKKPVDNQMEIKIDQLKDNKEAMRRYLLAKEGRMIDQYNLAVMYANGQGIEKDAKEAIKWYRLAAEQGYSLAQFNLAIMYAKGQGIEKDYNEAVIWYRLAAKQGYNPAQHNLAIMYENGQGVEKDIKEAIKWYQLAAEQGFAPAQYALGILYAHGRGLEKNDKKAIKWYQLAAEQKYESAQFNLACIYENGGRDVEKNYKKAIKWYQLAAEQGHQSARFNLARMYANGLGVKKNNKKAARWYRLAAEQGLNLAQYQLGLMYVKGRGVEKNHKEAARWFRLAAEQKDDSAQYTLGLMYENGQGVERDDKEALRWYQSAAEQEDIRALHKLSIRYRTGLGVLRDEKKADGYEKLATTVNQLDNFRQFVSDKKLEKQRSGSSAFLLKINERTASGTVNKGLYEYIFSPEVKTHLSYIPSNPPITKNQRGITCGLDALYTGLTAANPKRKVPPVRKNPIKLPEKEKKESKDISLRYIAKRYGSVMGEVFDIRCLKKTAEHFHFDSEVIKTTSKDYIQTVLDKIRSGHFVILPVDVNKDNFPDKMHGMGTHYALGWGIINKNNEDHIIVTQHGEHYLWRVTDLLNSHKQIPYKNPRSGVYYKDRENGEYYYHPKGKDSSLLEKDCRIIPSSTLEYFKFSTLAIPTEEKNVLSLTQCNENSIHQAVKSSDAVTLKLLLDSNVNIKMLYKKNTLLLKIAEKNHDSFSKTILWNAVSRKTKSSKQARGIDPTTCMFSRHRIK